jgi:xanthine dehydrogenase YagS FAD-binding subunit
MNSFEYASPTTVPQAVSLLSTRKGDAAVLAGGTDLLALVKDFVVTPGRLVNIKKIDALSGVRFTAKDGLRIRALTTLSDLAVHPAVRTHYPVLATAIQDAASPQIRNRATAGGNLCQRPRCWYFRNGFGLLALDPHNHSLVEAGDNRFHAILGNDGPAKFVSPSSIAPTLIALGADILLKGPDGSRRIRLGDFFIIPKSPAEREHDLRPNEIIVEIHVPPPGNISAAYYEIRQKHGFDWPFATATAILSLKGERVASATIMLGHVAPIPWRSKDAEAVLTGQVVTPDLARSAAAAAVHGAKSLGQNGYKIKLAQAAVRRAILQAVNIDPLNATAPSSGGLS